MSKQRYPEEFKTEAVIQIIANAAALRIVRRVGVANA